MKQIQRLLLVLLCALSCALPSAWAAAKSVKIVRATPVFFKKKKVATAEPGDAFKFIKESPEGKWVAVQSLDDPSIKGWVSAKNVKIGGGSKRHDDELEEGEEDYEDGDEGRRSSLTPEDPAAFDIGASFGTQELKFGFGLGFAYALPLTVLPEYHRLEIGFHGSFYPFQSALPTTTTDVNGDEVEITRKTIELALFPRYRVGLWDGRFDIGLEAGMAWIKPLVGTNTSDEAAAAAVQAEVEAVSGSGFAFWLGIPMSVHISEGFRFQASARMALRSGTYFTFGGGIEKRF